MTSKKKIAVVGAGSWGTALANVFADAGHEPWIWGRDAAVVESLASRHRNEKYLPGQALSERIAATLDLDEALDGAELILCAVPTQKIRQVFTPVARKLDGRVVLNASKGIEEGSLASVSEIFRELAPGARYVVLSGPSFALEVVQRLPTAVTVASVQRELAQEIQQRMRTPYFRAYTSSDAVGVEFAGALKNVVAIASGIVTGLRLGYNAQAALINRGIAEMIRMGKKRGAQPLTFLGLAGMGDLILTCTGPLSRNRRLGVGLGEGKKQAEIQRELGGVAEGVYTARSAYELAQRDHIDMPITEQVFRVLYQGSSARSAVTELMGRDLKEEWDHA